MRADFYRFVAQTSPFPLGYTVDYAKGAWIHTLEGKSMLDLISGIAVSSLGHCHPAVVNAVTEQAQKFMHIMVYGEFVYQPQVELCKAIVSLLGHPFEQVYLVNSGAEAIEGAMKLAKKYTNRPKIASCNNAYHGSTQGALSLIGSEVYQQPFRPLLPGVFKIRFNNIDDLAHIDEQTAAVFIETVQGEAGCIVPSPTWIQALQSKCHQTGTLIVCDEIQTGFGRCGSWFAFQQLELKPDIVCMAKGMGGGMPIGAFAASTLIMKSLSMNPILGHITTFGGNAVTAAAALAVIQTIQNENLLSRVQPLVKLFKKQLTHSKILAFRNFGLLMALDLGANEKVLKVMHHCLAQGVLVDWFLFNDTSLRICPPLILKEEEAIWACNVILEAFDTL